MYKNVNYFRTHDPASESTTPERLHIFAISTGMYTYSCGLPFKLSATKYVLVLVDYFFLEINNIWKTCA